MALKFAANLNWLFHETPSLCERFALAKQAGFQAVECANPYNTVPLEELKTALSESGLQVVHMNSYPGDGREGLAAVPPRVEEFKESLEQSIQYAKALNCPRMHILAGCKPKFWMDDAMGGTYEDNVKYAADRLQKEGITAVIEGISSAVVPGYYMDHCEKALACVQKVNHPNLKLLLDIFHLQMTEGNLTANIKKYLPFTDYVQIAQAPGRGEPDSEGEINYKYVLGVLRECNYQGWVGLEYKPTGSTADGLKWMQTYL